MTEVRVQNGTVSRHISLLFDLEQSNLVRTSSHQCRHLHFFQTLARSEFKHGRQAAILENQPKAIDPKLRTYR
jgi:hypothetical protein